MIIALVFVGLLGTVFGMLMTVFLAWMVGRYQDRRKVSMNQAYNKVGTQSRMFTREEIETRVQAMKQEECQ